MNELEGAVNFELAQDRIPDINIDNVIVERFGLNYDFINANRLAWIDGLSTGSGKRLDDIGHPDHKREYVQSYLKNYCPDWVPPVDNRHPGTGARKCESNALVVRPRAARKLCLEAILRYLRRGDPACYLTALKEPREELRREIMRYGYTRATHDQAGRHLIRPPQRNSNRRFELRRSGARAMIDEDWLSDEDRDDLEWSRRAVEEAERKRFDDEMLPWRRGPKAAFRRPNGEAKGEAKPLPPSRVISAGAFITSRLAALSSDCFPAGSSTP
jgi:hypothetical protein